MTNLADVESFLGQERLAIVGASASGKGFGVAAFKELRKKGRDVTPIHPSAEAIDGLKAYRSFADLPQPVGGVLVVVPPEQTESVVLEAADAGIRHIWLQQGAESEKAVSLCKERGISVIHGECILMFANPVGFPHNIHRWVWGLVGKLPQ